jgi:hypothetical protein
LVVKEMTMSNSRGRLWRWCGVIAAVVICIVIAFGAWLDHTFGEPRRISDQIGDTIASLAKKCPPDMTQDQWNVAVSWTNNLPGNSLLLYANLDDLRTFQRELEKKVQGKADMKLISWIWDEHARLTPAGQWYKQNFQRIMLDEMQLSEPDRIVSEIRKTIGSLSTRCPPDMTKEQWEVAVSWTGKLPYKSMLLTGGQRGLYDMQRFRCALDDLRRFQRELEERVKGEVDMELIFWIWDEHAKLTPTGQQYKQRFQKVMLDEMQGKR